MCLDAIFGGGKSSPPPVVQSSPIADQAKIEADAAAKAAQERTAQRRRQRGNSLLAQGAQGDQGLGDTTPGAKPTLGA